MKKKEAKFIIAVLMNARRAGIEAGEAKLKELQKAGDRWSVVDENNKEVGKMLDVCGLTSLHLPGRGRIVRAFKLLGRPDRFGDLAINGFSISKNTYRGGYGLIANLSNRQELSIRENAVSVFCNYLSSKNLKCSWSSRID